eukprot:jgi/Psemu1/42767/gm1.42767_g
MNTQFQPRIQYKRTFDITKDHNSHKLKSTELGGGRGTTLYTYDLFVDTCNDLGMPVARWHTQWGQCLLRGPRKRWNETLANRETEHTKEGFRAMVLGVHHQCHHHTGPRRKRNNDSSI